MIKAKKSLGQNFLVDTRVARRIVEAVSPLPTDVIIEIGPGTGALTRMLIERSGYVVAIEIDGRLVDELRGSVTAENFAIMEADALEVDWSEIAVSAVERLLGHADREDAKPRVRIVANLPYYISTPIIERLLRAHRTIFDMTLMLQSEVADRITSEPGRKEYGYLSVLVQYHCAATKLFEVPPSAFKPAPKVWSAIVRLLVREWPAADVEDEAKFFALVRAAFAQRRKTIANNLKASAGALPFARSSEAALEQARIEGRRRAETLSIEEFASLYRALFL